MFRGPSFIVSTMQAGTTPIFNVFGGVGRHSGKPCSMFYSKKAKESVKLAMEPVLNSQIERRTSKRPASTSAELRKIVQRLISSKWKVKK